MNKIKELAEAYTRAWNSRQPDAVAGFYAADGRSVINAGAPWQGHASIAEMAAGFFADVPDLALICDAIRSSGTHAVYFWTFTGHDAQTKRPLRVSGWEEWDLDGEMKVALSMGWFDSEDYARQVGGG